MKKTYFLIFIFLFFGLVFNNFAQSSEESGADKKVVVIEIKGNKLISTQTVLLKIKTKAGEPFSQNKIEEDIKSLYSLGFFSDVKVDLQDYQDGLMVVFLVTEKPVLDRITFDGNKMIKKDKISEVMKSKIGEFLNPKQLKEDVNEIKALYEKKGFPFADIEYDTVIDEKTNKAVVHILINEEKRVRIKKISVTGNSSFKAKKLFKIMSTKPDTLFTSGFFKKELFEEDLEKIKAFYEEAGFIEVKVTSDISFDGKKQKMYIIIHIDEGKRYFVGEITIEGNEIFPEGEIKNTLNMKNGSIFSQRNLGEDTLAIQRYYFEKGYIFADIKATPIYNEELEKVDINYSVVEGELAYVDKIRIIGNIKTKDKVIRRELKIVPGDIFDGSKLRRSKEKLNNLGFFEEVSYSTEPGTAPNRKDLVVEVKEAKTGEFSFGAGYSSIDKFVGFVELGQKNFDIGNFPTFTGAGQDLRLRAELGSERKNYELSFTEPWMFDRPISFGFDIYNRDREWEDYDERRRGGDIRLGKTVGEYTTVELMHRIEEIKIYDVGINAASDIKDEEGNNLLSSMMLKVTRDTRDNVFNPTKGTTLSNSIECAGGPFGGDKDFLRYTYGSSWYVTHFKKFVLEVKLRAGLADSFANTDKVPIYERFYTGGANTIRGYKERRVGPKDNGDPIGGDSMLIGNFEYTFPIAEYLKGAVFYDVGNVWSKVDDFCSGGLRSGAGVGIRVKTPVGPIKLDYGYPLNPEEGESRGGRFHFTIGRRF